MAKASDIDIGMALDLSNDLDSLVRYKSFPESLRPDCEFSGAFDADNGEHCREVVRHLLQLVRSASLTRVVLGMAVLLDPENKIVDPDKDTLEHHPEIESVLKDVERLNWPMHFIPGSVWRNLGVNYGAGCDRATLDAAIERLDGDRAPQSMSGFLTFRELKERGWSNKMVQSLLGVADDHAANPHFKMGRPMRLYALTRVMDLERQIEFQVARAAAQSRGVLASAQFAEKSRVQERISTDIQIKIPVWSAAQLRDLATKEFGIQTCSHLQAMNELEVVMGHAKAAEWALDSFFWHPGIRPVRQKLRRRILGDIVNKYPQLAHVALARGKLENGDCNA